MAPPWGAHLPHCPNTVLGCRTGRHGWRKLVPGALALPSSPPCPCCVFPNFPSVACPHTEAGLGGGSRGVTAPPVAALPHNRHLIAPSPLAPGIELGPLLEPGRAGKVGGQWQTNTGLMGTKVLGSRFGLWHLPLPSRAHCPWVGGEGS